MGGEFPSHIRASLSPFPQQRVAPRFTLALASAVGAIILRGLLDPVLGHVAFYVTVYMAVAFCAAVCGAGPAAVSAFFGFVGILYWFVDPRHSLWVIRRSEIHGIIGCFLVCAVLIFLGDANREKHLRLNATIKALNREAAERQRAEEKLHSAYDQLEQRVEERTAALAQALFKLESEGKVRQQAEEQLRHLSVRLMTTQDEERRHIARELHDSTGQTLAAVKMTLASLRFKSKAPEFLTILDDANALVDGAIREIRTTSYLLHPPLLDEAGITSAARWFVEGFSKRSGIQVIFDIPDQLRRLPRQHELVFFRVLQESLTNVHRHSDASAVTIALTQQNDQITLEIEDNGKGISEEAARRLSSSTDGSGVGIAGMRERVRELGGTFELRSSQTGSTVSVALPFVQEAPATETTFTATGG